MSPGAETWSKMNSPQFCPIGTLFSPLLYQKFRGNRVRDPQYKESLRKYSYFLNVSNYSR